MKSGLFVLISLALASTTVSANDWRQISLKATDGSAIAINYQLKKLEAGVVHPTSAAPLWINVTRRNAGTLRAVITSFESSTGNRAQSYLESTTQVDLLPSGMGRRDSSGVYIPGGFTSYAGEVTGGLMVALYDTQSGHTFETFFQEISFVDEKGEWLTDPISGTHNFQFELR